MISESTVYRHLKRVGVPPSLNGYEALFHAIMIVGNENVPRQMTKKIYPMVAERVGSTPQRVERSMRHAIERVFDATDHAVLVEYFGNIISQRSGKLKNSEFIYGMVEYIRHYNQK